jgi:hypothetical protein
LIILILLFCLSMAQVAATSTQAGTTLGQATPVVSSTNCAGITPDDCNPGCPLVHHQMVVVSDTSAEWQSGSGWQQVQLAQHLPCGSFCPYTPWGSSAASWVWPYALVDQVNKEGPFTIRQSFSIPCCATGISTKINITANKSYVLSYNGQTIGSGSTPAFYAYMIPDSYYPASQTGENIIQVTAVNSGSVLPDNPSGVIYEITIDYSERDLCTPPTTSSCYCCCAGSACPSAGGCGETCINFFGISINFWLIIWTLIAIVLVIGIIYYIIKKTQ